MNKQCLLADPILTLAVWHPTSRHQSVPNLASKSRPICAKFYLNRFTVAIQGWKTASLITFWTFRAHVPTSYALHQGQIWQVKNRLMDYTHKPNFIRNGSFCCPWGVRKTQNWPLFNFNILRWQHLTEHTKAESWCVTTNLPLSNNIKTISIFKCLNGKVTFTNFTIQKLHS